MRLPITLLLLSLLCTCARAQVPTDPIALIGNSEDFVCPPCNGECDDLAFPISGTCPHCSMQLVHKDSVIRPEVPTTIAFYLQSGVEVLDFAGPLEVLSYAGFQIFTVSKTKAPIISQGILRITPDYSIEDAPKADILAFFGGNGYSTSQDEALINWVKKQEDVKLHFSVCTGALILAEAGILDGKTATTYHNAIDILEEDYPNINVLRDVRYVDNGDVISTAGISAGIDGALHLVAKLKGYNMARATAYNMEYDNWQPGAGLLLSPDDPYSSIPAAEDLKEYTGTFNHWNIDALVIRYNERDRGIEAYFRQQRFPLYYQQKDVFTDTSGDTVTFQRDASGKIIGYSHSQHPGEVYSVLAL